MSNGYHFCKDCAYRSKGIIKEVKDGKQTFIEFMCFKYGNPERGTLYYKGDFDKFKISCPEWEPYQNDFIGETT